MEAKPISDLLTFVTLRATLEVSGRWTWRLWIFSSRWLCMCTKPTAMGLIVAHVCLCASPRTWQVSRILVPDDRLLCTRMKKYAKHFQAIIGLIPVMEEASHSILKPTLPLWHFCSPTLLSLHFLQSLQPCFLPFIRTVFFLHPPHPSYLLLFPHLSSLRHCLTLLCAMCASCLLLLLTPLLLYLHPFALLNPEASLCMCAWAITQSHKWRAHLITSTPTNSLILKYFLTLFTQADTDNVHKLECSTPNLIVRQTLAVMILRGN